MRHVSKTYSTVVYVAIHHTRVARSDPACVHVVHSVGGTAARGSVRSINCVEGSHGPKGFEKYVSDLLVIMPMSAEHTLTLSGHRISLCFEKAIPFARDRRAHAGGEGDNKYRAHLCVAVFARV